MIKFYDTSSLLKLQEKAFEDNFHISYITLSELENIKTSGTKSEEIKYKARKLTRLLDIHNDKYECHDYKSTWVVSKNEVMSNDIIIVETAKQLSTHEKELVFYTDDICLKNIARGKYGLNVKSVEDNNCDLEYKGYKTVRLTDDEMAILYESSNVNTYDCLTNEYLIVENINGDIVDGLKWNGEKYIPLVNKTFSSRMFGKIKPYDEIQRFAFDSIINNDITVLYGRSGSGKTTIPVSYIMQQLETQKFSRCNIIFHYEPLKGAKTLGFEKGSHTEKVLNYGSLGNILSSKFGDIQQIEAMITSGMLNIIPTCNIRGVEFSEDEIVYVTESQNIDVYTLKTIIQRCKKGCKQIYEGDILEQSDINCGQLGLHRMIEVFSGHGDFGCVNLKNNYRSELVELADKM